MSSIYSQSIGSDIDSSHDHHISRRRDVVLRASTGSFGPSTIPILMTLLNPQINQPIASVTIDTDDLDDPTILVQFNGVLTSTAAVAAGLTYDFTLFRNCRGSGFREELRSFSISQVAAGLNLPDSRGLSFAFNQSGVDCERCCTYTLELTRITSTVAVNLNVTITGTLSVLAVSDED